MEGVKEEKNLLSYDYEPDITLINVEGRIYRCNKADLPKSENNSVNLQFEKGKQGKGEKIEDEEIDENSVLKFDYNKKKFSLKQKTSSSYFGIVIGKGGETKKKIQTRTNTFINLSNENNEIGLRIFLLASLRKLFKNPSVIICFK